MVLACTIWVDKVLRGKVTEAKVNAMWLELQKDSRMINDQGGNPSQGITRR